MTEVFLIMQFSNSTSVTPLPNIINLLEQWDSLDIGILEQHIRFLHSYGQEYDLRNLTWTLELLENSCDQNLADKIQQDLLDVELSLECGLMLLYLTTRRIISSTEDAVVAMTE